MKIEFIGLGRMGGAMAANLVRAGHEVTVFNRSPGRSAELVQLGAQNANHLADACAGRVVLSMLANDEAAADIALGEGGIIHHLANGALHVSMSTISVGRGAHRQGRHRPGCICRVPHLDRVRRPGIQDLRAADRATQVRARGFYRTARIQGHPSHAGRGRGSSRTDAARKFAA